ncbi:hypothetical protein KY495_00170 [Massilia sp. PAMC28688]|uniref:hypothetical protein n=1 Tax=Massilia sp. PAMC28688 TaxID=2861283 RepID=UPI001C63A1F4|nr:hypothetical protein [Massilia sp. PAMC28688]QYF93696.1 hypothetical protein KY495_00170 [Massilia sp. PAMC28688]
MLLRTACRDACRHIDIPIVRGFSGDAPLYRLEGTQGERQSRSDEHYHTIIMDEFLPHEGYPRRSESIICGNWLNLQYAGDYGATYAIFPFDGIPIGVTYGHDFLDTRIAMDHFRPRSAPSIMEWNALFKSLGLRDDSYAAFREDVQRLRGKGGDIDAMFPAGADVDEVLRHTYGSSRMRLQIVTPVTLATIQDRQREMWFSGPCVAIRIDQLDTIKRLL